MAKKQEEAQQVRKVRQIPFQNSLVVVGQEEHQHNIVNITMPDEGAWVYVVDTLEEGPALMLTPDNMDGVDIVIKHSISA